jgi:hypothetical protein
MPAATTELFGDRRHEIYADLTQATSATLTANCPVATISAGPTLDIQYSTDNGATWAALGGSSSIFIDGINNILGNCGTAPFLTIGATFAVATLARAKVFLRIIGTGGNGVSDAPVFTEIHLSVFSTITNNCNQGIIAGPSYSKTGFIYRVICTLPVTQTFAYNWTAGIYA